MLVDTHCHLNMIIKERSGAPLEAEDIVAAQHVVADAAAAGVGAIIDSGVNLVESRNSVALAKAIDSVWATVAIHPGDCSASWRGEFVGIEELVRDKEQNRIIGVGECGIDRHYPGHDLACQVDMFRAHIELALAHDLPVIIHSRDAYDETLKVLEEYKNDLRRGVMHCFAYDRAFTQHVFPLGFVLGIGGVLTYPRNEAMRELITDVPLDRIVLETDAPFLAPQSKRGQQNVPKYLPEVAQKIAELKEIAFEEVCRETTETVRRIFGPLFTLGQN